MKMKLHAKDDGLWLELKPDATKSSALIRVGPESTTLEPKGNIIDRVCHAVWQEIRLAERRQVITDLNDEQLARKIWELARGFKDETRWMMLETIERMGVDLDQEDDPDE